MLLEREQDGVFSQVLSFFWLWLQPTVARVMKRQLNWLTFWFAFNRGKYMIAFRIITGEIVLNKTGEDSHGLVCDDKKKVTVTKVTVMSSDND